MCVTPWSPCSTGSIRQCLRPRRLAQFCRERRRQRNGRKGSGGANFAYRILPAVLVGHRKQLYIEGCHNPRGPRDPDCAPIIDQNSLVLFVFKLPFGLLDHQNIDCLKLTHPKFQDCCTYCRACTATNR